MNKLALLSVFAFSTFFLAGCGTQPTEEIIDEVVVEDVIVDTDTTDDLSLEINEVEVIDEEVDADAEVTDETIDVITGEVVSIDLE